LAHVLDIPFEQALREAGGRAWEERRSDFFRQVGGTKNLPKPGTPEARLAAQKSGQARKGRGHSPEHAAARVAAWKASGGGAKAVAALVELNRSLKGRLLASLRMYLRRATAAPDRATLVRWAEQASTWSGVPSEGVLAIWRPDLKARGIVSAV